MLMDMTNEELTELIEMHSHRLDLLTEAFATMRDLVLAQSQRIDNIDHKLFGPKEP